MSYLQALKKESSKTSTLNGAVAYGTSGDSCLDLFAMAGGMRYRRKNEQINLFTKAYIENPELAMKLLFHIRDIREGMGERSTFRTLLRYVAVTWPESAKKNVALVAEYGRFDDLLCLLHTPAEKEVIDVVKEQLEKDIACLKLRENGEPDAPISLLAKWMPSINASSKRTRKVAAYLAGKLGMGRMEYQKTLASLRKNIGLTECYLTSRKADHICYEAVPSHAMMKYREAFLRNDEERFLSYLLDVSSGEKQIHCNVLFPYEIFSPVFNRVWRGRERKQGEDVLECLWDAQKGQVGDKNALAIIDTSGSMFWRKGNGPLPAMMAQALGLFYAERCEGFFHNHFMTFDYQPCLMEIHGKTLEDKIRYISKAPWGGSTNLEAVFNLLLTTALDNNIPQEEMPKSLYIFSDMEFDCAFSRPEKTVFDSAKAMFEEAGYELPVIIFHNVNSWQNQVPVRSKTRGTAMVSGASTNSIKEEYSKNITPMEAMLRVLLSDRYKEIHA